MRSVKVNSSKSRVVSLKLQPLLDGRVGKELLEALDDTVLARGSYVNVCLSKGFEEGTLYVSDVLTCS